MPANLVTVSIALRPSPSLLLATLIAATVIAAAIALVVAHPAPLLPSLLPPLRSPSSLLATLVALAIPSSSPLPSLIRHPHCRHVALGGGGEDHTNPVRDPTSAANVGATILVAAFAARATSREGPVQQCAGFQCPADSLRQRGRASVGVCVAGIILLANRRRWRWRQHADGGGGGSVGNAATK